MKLFKKGQGNFIKILSLSIGLTIGLVLLAKVNWEEHYDAYIEDIENVYTIHEYINHESDGFNEYQQTPGGIAPWLKLTVPAIEAATRITQQNHKCIITTDDKRDIEAIDTYYADSSFFKIFTREIIAGDPKCFAIAGQAMVSKSFAEKLGGDVIGRTFVYEEKRDYSLTIAGIFENFPDNSSFADLDILLSLPTIGQYSYDGSENMYGNERYHSYVRLAKGTDMEQLQNVINNETSTKMPMEEFAKAGYIEIGFRPVNIIDDRNSDTTYVATKLIMLIVAIILLATAVLNYILVVISSLVSRVKDVAVRKCYSAPDLTFYKSAIIEAGVHVGASILVAAMLFSLGNDIIKELLGASVESLFSIKSLAIAIVVCLIIIATCGIVPGYIYTHIPLEYAFRRFSESRRWWKLTLLAFQFFLSTMLLSVVFVIYGQYNHLMKRDLGYDHHNVAYIIKSGELTADQFHTLSIEIGKMPFVESSATMYMPFCNGASGDNITLPGQDKVLFNCANLFCVEPEMFDVLKMTVVEGELYKSVPDLWDTRAMVDENFAARLKSLTGWETVIGQKICNSSFGDKEIEISGVFKNIKVGSLLTPETRPCMMINGHAWSYTINIRLNEITADNMNAIRQKANELFPGQNITVDDLTMDMGEFYHDIERIRDLIVIGCIATLLISIIGLIGYINDEVQRRSRELAIRKVNGASVWQLQKLFLRSVVHIALPSLLAGAGVGYYLSAEMLTQFPDKIDLSILIFAGSIVIIATIITIVVTARTYKIASDDPTDNLKNN